MAKGGKLKKSKFIIIGVVLVVIVVSVIACSMSSTSPLYAEETVTQRDISTYYSFAGTVSSKNKQDITADTIMQVKTCHVKIGDKVKKDQKLLTLNGSQTVNAAMDGEVVSINAEDGGIYQAGQELMTIADMNSLQVDIKVDEYDIAAAEVSKDANIYVNALKRDIKGKVTNVSRKAVTNQGVTYFEAAVSVEPDQDLKLGLSADVTMLNKSVASVMSISMSALNFDKENKTFVYLKDKNGKETQKYVTVGVNDGNYVEIVEGLSLGDKLSIHNSNSELSTTINTQTN